MFSGVTALDLLQPLAFVKEASSTQLLTTGPFEVDCDLAQTAEVAQHYQDTLLQPASS